MDFILSNKNFMQHAWSNNRSTLLMDINNKYGPNPTNWSSLLVRILNYQTQTWVDSIWTMIH